MLARIENNAVAELRDLALEAIPEHKRVIWRPVVYEGEGPLTETIIEPSQVRIVRSVPAPTANDVRAEAQRRIVGLVGATDLMSCLIKQLNANMRANELNDIMHSRDLTAEEYAEAVALRSLATQIKAIRASSNVLEPNPPLNYADNQYWPGV
jgi:hypothetical protein